MVMKKESALLFFLIPCVVDFARSSVEMRERFLTKTAFICTILYTLTICINISPGPINECNYFTFTDKVLLNLYM